ncbi:MAG: hypothetical protein KC668_16945 [Myxococcales bacterium]|nr:hypothetical protein [Myxococcales bacterium]
MCRTFIGGVRVYAGLVLTLSLALPGGAWAQRRPMPTPTPTPTATAIPGRIAGGGTLESDGLLGAHLRGARVTQAGRVAQLAGRQIEVSPGQRAPLSAITPVLFAEQDALRSQLTAARGATLGAVETHDEVYDLGDRVAVVRTTRFVVANVAVAQRGSPVLRTYFQARGAQPATITPEVRAGLAEMRAELQRAPAGHPLRAAADQGDDALLAAIARGEGELEVVDTFVLPSAALPTRNGAVLLPANSGSRYEYANMREVMRIPPVRDFTQPSMVASQMPDAVSVEVNAPRERSVTNGPAVDLTYEFVNGFTIGRAWEWERRWNYASGFFRVTFKAGLGFGVRVPIRAHVRMTPSFIRVVDSADRSDAFMTTVRFETLEADPAFYTRAGISQGQLFDGKELVVEAFAGFGYKFRALWHDWAHRPYEEVRFDYGHDFAPPYGANWESVRDIFIPAETTQTAVDLGIIRGGVQAGVQLAARGRVTATFRALVQGSRTASTYGGGSQNEWRRVFSSPTESVTWGATIPTAGNVTNTRTYGFEVGDLSYTSDWSVVPGARVFVTVGVPGFSRTFDTTVWIEQLRLELGSVTLGRHEGTRQWARDERGRKQFRNMFQPTGSEV